MVTMKVYFILLIPLLCCKLAVGQSTVFSTEEVSADLQTLHTSLKKAHFDAFFYTEGSTFDSTFRALHASITGDSIGLLQTTGLFQQLVSTINNGHTEIDFPASAYTEYAYADGTVFPLELAFEDGQALIRKNWSDNEGLSLGVEVLRINGIEIGTILERIYPHVSAERPYFKNAKIEVTSFPRLYWQVYGAQDEFEVELRIGEGVVSMTIPAVNLIEGYEMIRTEVLDASKHLEFMGTTAYLDPGNFAGDEEAFRQFIDSAFTVISENRSENLIIDLRNNAGGNDEFSDHLVSYIADRPFKWNSSFTLKTSRLLKEHIRANFDTTYAFWQEALRRPNGEQYPYEFEPQTPQSEERRFAGKVYVLANRQTHSQAAVTVAQMQDFGFATVVGEETGEYPSLLASQFQFTLPNTGIVVKIAKGHIVRVNGSKEEIGVVPDIYIRDHLLDKEDEILEGLQEMINDQR